MPFLFQSCIDFNNFQAWRYLCFLVTFSWTNYTPVRKLWVFLTTFCVLSFQLCSKTSVFLVSIGVVLTTLSRPSSPSKRSTEDLEQYIIGIFMLTISSLLTGVLGMLQELTYRKYGPCWREGVFYTVSFIFCTAKMSLIIVMALSIFYLCPYSYSWFQTSSKVLAVCLHHHPHFLDHILSWLETLLPNLSVFLESTGSHLYVFEMICWSWCLCFLFWLI